MSSSSFSSFCSRSRRRAWGFSSLLLLSASFLSSFDLARAADYNFGLSVPIQCENMTVSVTGGTPPYQLLVIPVGSVNPETRRIFTVQFSGMSTSFRLNYPARSQFVAVMSDATGVGTGGTTIANTVAASQDDSCLSPTISPLFYFYIAPMQLTQCQTNVFNANSSAQGTVRLYGVIPGGDTFSFNIATGQDVNWQASVRAGTSVTFIAGDDRGIGTGGSAGPYVVQDGASGCLNGTSPSSTAGSPAGAVTGAPSGPSSSASNSGSSTAPGPSNSQGGGGSSGGGGSNTGAIVGGVVGGVVGLALITGLFFWLFCLRRRKDGVKSENQNVDLAGEAGNSSASGSHEHPAMTERGDGFYTPAPFVVPEAGGGSSTGRASTDNFAAGTRGPESTSGGGSSSVGPFGAAASRTRRVSGISDATSDPASSSANTPRTGAARDRKVPPSALRATNLVQHEDAEVANLRKNEDGEEVVELPPTYDTLRGGRAARTAAGGKQPQQ